jgi:hypothetical protein
MVKKKKPSKEELKDILHDEEIEARYNSRDMKRLNKLEKEHEWYLEYTKKDLHPISYQIEQELKRSAPHSKGLTDGWVWGAHFLYLYVGIAITVLWASLGFVMLIYLLSQLY